MILGTQLPYLRYILYYIRIHVDFLPCALFRPNWFHLSPMSCVICLEPINIFSTRPIVRQGRCRRLSGYLLQQLDNKYLVADVNRTECANKGNLLIATSESDESFKKSVHLYIYITIYKKNTCSSQTGRSVVVLSYMTMCFIKTPVGDFVAARWAQSRWTRYKGPKT